jgi:hypothetical protein
MRLKLEHHATHIMSLRVVDIARSASNTCGAEWLLFRENLSKNDSFAPQVFWGN